MELNGIQTGRAALALVAVLAAALAAQLLWDACMAGMRRAQLHEVRQETLRAAIEAGAAAEAAASGWGEADGEFWSHFRGAGEAQAAPEGPLAGRYRLAGVFRMLGGGGECAILDDVKAGRQLLLATGEEEEGLKVEEVGADYAVVSDGAKRERLVIASGVPGNPDGEGEERAAAAAEGAPTVISTNRFGAQVGETRWEVSRDAVMEYYQEMMDNPERLVGLFNALEPDYGADDRIEGYRVNTERGEAEFFDEVGIRQGDVVRRVNSLHMTSQKRAEYFIGEFVKGDLGAVVLDIEREGRPEKLVYLIK
jgi:type II secretory pathway component PulC